MVFYKRKKCIKIFVTLLINDKIPSIFFRARKYMYPSSYEKVKAECEQRMVGDHLSYLHSECKPMVSGEKRGDLANLYRLLRPIAGAQV